MFMPELVFGCFYWLRQMPECWFLRLVWKPYLDDLSAKRSPYMNVGYSGMVTFLHLKYVTGPVSYIQAC